ncbi:YceI family protein [Sunxiuqinia sp. A32]|uniref:YceI family protein n=1 Tax=Sunxiuqinia sp. A32 TaxID=3461496 RepID=UPI004045FC9F
MFAIKTSLSALVIVFSNYIAESQIAVSKSVVLSFFSEAPLEDIYAESKKGVSAIDLDSQLIYFKVPIRTFEFEKSLMQKHFNENYLESDKYPNAEFNGTILDTFDIRQNGILSVKVKGDLKIHNVTKSYAAKGEISIFNQEITAKSTFNIRLVDHNIKIPRLVIKNIAEVVEVSVLASYKLKQN